MSVPDGVKSSGSGGEQQQPRQRIGAYLCVYLREGEKPPTEAYLVHNHYLARRLITTEGYHTHKVPGDVLSRIFNIDHLAIGINDLGEGLFFVGRLVKTWFEVKGEMQLDASKHYVKIFPAEGYLFPKNLFQNTALKDLMGNFTSSGSAAVGFLMPLAIWDDPLVFAEAMGLSAALIFFLYFLFREVSKFGK